MPKKILGSITEQVERIKRRSKADARRSALKLVDQVYQSNDFTYIETFNLHLAALIRADEAGSLEQTIEKSTAALSVSRQRRPSSESKQEQDSLTIGESIRYWRAYDTSSRIDPMTNQTYRNRILKGERAGVLTRDPHGKLPINQLNQYIQSYAKDKKSSTKTRQTPTQTSSRARESYASLRGRFSQEEIMARHPELVPQGKNPGNFFDAMEEIYQRSIRK